MRNNSMSTLIRIFKTLGKSRRLVIISLAMAFIQVILSLRIPVLTGNAVDLAVSEGKVNFSGITAYLIQIGICAVFSAAFSWIMETANNRLSLNVSSNIRNSAFEKLHRLETSKIDTTPHGEMVSMVMSDVEQLSEGVLLGLTQIITGVITIAATLVFMLIAEPVIALLVALVTPVSLFVSSFVAKHTYGMFKAQAASRSKLTGTINESVSGMKTIRSFSMEEEFIKRFDAENTAFQRDALKATFFSSITNPSTRFVNSLVYATVAVSGALFCVNGSFTVGRLTCILSYASKYTKPFNEISGVVAEFQNALACAQRVFDFIDSAEENESSSHLTTVKDGHVEFKDVCFSYDKARKLIENLNLDVHPGMKVAIVGPTGCGKTTLINLIMRYYDTDSGSILLDGMDIREMPRGELRSNFGMVLQETWLSSGTIRDNLKFGNPNATDAEIEDACKRCHAHSFITRLPQGYDTQLSSDGSQLSAGQKQLLCIARVMLRKPKLLILDEATSSIDTRTEMRIQDAFNQLLNGRTAFIVAHRLSTIRSADLIVAMRDGHIEQTGSHNELMQKGGFYRELYLSQYK